MNTKKNNIILKSIPLCSVCCGGKDTSNTKYKKKNIYSKKKERKKKEAKNFPPKNPPGKEKIYNKKNTEKKCEIIANEKKHTFLHCSLRIN